MLVRVFIVRSVFTLATAHGTLCSQQIPRRCAAGGLPGPSETQDGSQPLVLLLLLPLLKHITKHNTHTQARKGEVAQLTWTTISLPAAPRMLFDDVVPEFKCAQF